MSGEKRLETGRKVMILDNLQLWKKLNEIEGKQKYMWFLYDTNETVSTKLISKSKTYCDLF